MGKVSELYPGVLFLPNSNTGQSRSDGKYFTGSVICPTLDWNDIEVSGIGESPFHMIVTVICKNNTLQEYDSGDTPSFFELTINSRSFPKVKLLPQCEDISFLAGSDTSISFKHGDVFLLRGSSSGEIHMLCLSTLSEIYRSSNKYVFPSDIEVKGAKYSLETLGTLVKNLSDKANNAVYLDSSGNITIPGEVIADAIRVQNIIASGTITATTDIQVGSISLKTVSNSLTTCMQTVTQLVADLTEVSSDLNSALVGIATINNQIASINDTLKNAVLKDSSNNITVNNVFFKGSDSSSHNLQELLTNLNDCITDLSSISEVVQANSNSITNMNVTISGSASRIESAENAISTLQTTLSNLKGLIDDLEEIRNIDFSKFAEYVSGTLEASDFVLSEEFSETGTVLSISGVSNTTYDGESIKSLIQQLISNLSTVSSNANSRLSTLATQLTEHINNSNIHLTLAEKLAVSDLTSPDLVYVVADGSSS